MCLQYLPDLNLTHIISKYVYMCSCFNIYERTFSEQTRYSHPLRALNRVHLFVILTVCS